MPSRRQFLHVGTTGVLASLAGCPAVPAPRPKLDLRVNNTRETAVHLEIRFFRPHVTERSEALIYRTYPEIPPQEDADDSWTVENVASDHPYRIEIVDGSTESSHHYHYRPDCSDNEPYEIAVVVNLNTGGGVTFTQTTCSSDEPFL